MSRPLSTDELFDIDTRVRSAFAALVAHRRAVARGEEPTGLVPPFASPSNRRVAGRSTFEALASLTSDPVHGAHARALRRLVAELTVSRVTSDDDDELRVAVRGATVSVDADVPELTATDAWLTILGTRERARRAAWFAAFADARASFEGPLRRLGERRAEASALLGLAHAAEGASRRPVADVLASARRWLDVTDDLVGDVRRDVARRLDVPVAEPHDLLFTAAAADAGDGFPARVSSHWLARPYSDLARGLTLRTEPFPEAVGASSFLRAVRAFGRALRGAGTARSLPFALAYDPHGEAARTFGEILASSLLSTDFHVRILGLSKRVAESQSRALTVTALVESRMSATRALVAWGGEPLDAVTARTFGRPLPRGFEGTWPIPSVGTTAPSFVADVVATFDGARVAEELVERHDSDWFANPRAHTFLRDLAARPAHGIDEGSCVPPLDVDGFRRLLERKLA